MSMLSLLSHAEVQIALGLAAVEALALVPLAHTLGRRAERRKRKAYDDAAACRRMENERAWRAQTEALVRATNPIFRLRNQGQTFTYFEE